MAIEKREQIFISSTFKDLVEERRAVIQTLLEADCIPAGMELFPASDDEKWQLIKRVIDLCDYYVVIIGGRYGSVDDKEQLSYTEMEFDYAVQKKKPVMGFLHGNPGKLIGEKLDLDPDLRTKLEAFRGKVERRMVKYWEKPEDLPGLVALSIIQIRKSHPAEGWIRASKALTPETEKELAELRQRVAELTNALGEEKRQHRLEDTEQLAQGDDEHMLEITLEYHTDENVAAGTTPKSLRKRARGYFSTTWNELFAYVGPSMIDEAPEHRIGDELDLLAQKIAERHSEGIPDLGALMDAEITGEAFDDIKVQLIALGLIEKSDRKRPVSDKASYWRLTEHGRETLMRLRAIRRGTDKPEPLTIEEMN